MVKFTRDEVLSAAGDALCYGAFGGYGRYVRLRDAIRKDAKETGNYEDYKRFVAYSNEAIEAYLKVYRDFFYAGTGLLILENEEDRREFIRDWRNRLLVEWPAGKALDDDKLKEIMDG